MQVVLLSAVVDNFLEVIDAFISDLCALKGVVVIEIDVVGSFVRFFEPSVLTE